MTGTVGLRERHMHVTKSKIKFQQQLIQQRNRKTITTTYIANKTLPPREPLSQQCSYCVLCVHILLPVLLPSQVSVTVKL